MLVIESERLIFREWEAKDAPRLREILTDPLTMQFWPKPFDEESLQNWQERAYNRYRGTGNGRFALVLKETNEVIGDAGIMESMVDGQLEFDLGYIIHHPFWGKGYATEAAKALLEHGFRNLRMYRIVVNMAEEHVASRHVAEKLGLALEKTFVNERNLGKKTLLFSSSRQAYEEMRRKSLFSQIADSTEKVNWLALAMSEENANRVLALETAAGFPGQLQTELLHWFCTVDHIQTRQRIFDLLDEAHQELALAAVGEVRLPALDDRDSFVYFQAAADLTELRILAEMELEGTPLPNYRIVFVRKYIACTGKGMQEGKAAMAALMQRAKAMK